MPLRSSVSGEFRFDKKRLIDVRLLELILGSAHLSQLMGRTLFVPSYGPALWVIIHG